jgi:hypothetical protein
MSVLPGSIRESDRVVLVRLVARGLSEGTITLEDVKGLTGREIRALLVERTGAQSGRPYGIHARAGRAGGGLQPR